MLVAKNSRCDIIAGVSVCSQSPFDSRDELTAAHGRIEEGSSR